MRTSHRGPATASADPAERNSYVTLPDAQKPKPIPSLRVVRHVATAQDAVRAGAGFDMVEDLGMFVDAAARKNRASGYGYSVGSMALTLVSEREVQTMIQTSRPRIKRRDEIELRRRLAASVRQHNLRRQSDAAYARAQQHYIDRAVRAPGYVDDGRSTYRSTTNEWVDADDSPVVDDILLTLTSVERVELDVHRYGHQILTASGIKFMGGKRWALTFPHESTAALRGERRELLDVFATHDLSTRDARRTPYEPHVTFFHLHGHIPDSTSLQLSADFAMPTVWMLPPAGEQ